MLVGTVSSGTIQEKYVSISFNFEFYFKNCKQNYPAMSRERGPFRPGLHNSFKTAEGGNLWDILNQRNMWVFLLILSSILKIVSKSILQCLDNILARNYF